jgi:hypothetical protein
MPKGKISPRGGIAWIPHNLPDCTCEALLNRDRRKSDLGHTEDMKSGYRVRVNNAVKRYIGASVTARPGTKSEYDQSIAKGIVAAVKLLLAMKAGNEIRAKKWRITLADRTDINIIGHYTWTSLNSLLRSQGGDIVSLGKLPFIIGKLPLSETYLNSVKILSNLKPPEITGVRFRDPHLFMLIAELSSVWREVTGRKPLPASVRWRQSDQKKYLFAEWVQEVIATAALALEKQRNEAGNQLVITQKMFQALQEFRQIEVPKEGSILDIVRALSSKKQKSGPPRQFV